MEGNLLYEKQIFLRRRISPGTRLTLTLDYPPVHPADDKKVSAIHAAI